MYRVFLTLSVLFTFGVKIRPLWRHYYPNTHGLIFVVDSNDNNRFDEAKKELDSIVNDDEMKGAVVLIFANKQDLDGAKTRGGYGCSG